MPGIVCAIRGSPDSQPTIDKAISLARETNFPIYFLYVVNLDFLSRTESSRTSTLSDELEHMGEFILLAAQEKIKAQKVTTEGIIKHGKVDEEIVGLTKEIQADYVVLGLPQGVEEKDVFAIDRIKELYKQIESEAGAKVVFAERPQE
jgi:nucleotide-binding universal stress UspA family protein